MKRNPLPMSQDPAHNWQAANGGKRALGKHAGFQQPYNLARNGLYLTKSDEWTEDKARARVFRHDDEMTLASEQHGGRFYPV